MNKTVTSEPAERRRRAFRRTAERRDLPMAEVAEGDEIPRMVAPSLASWHDVMHLEEPGGHPVNRSTTEPTSALVALDHPAADLPPCVGSELLRDAGRKDGIARAGTLRPARFQDVIDGTVEDASHAFVHRAMAHAARRAFLQEGRLLALQAHVLLVVPGAVRALRAHRLGAVEDGRFMAIGRFDEVSLEAEAPPARNVLEMASLHGR